MKGYEGRVVINILHVRLQYSACSLGARPFREEIKVYSDFVLYTTQEMVACSRFHLFSCVTVSVCVHETGGVWTLSRE